MRAIEFTLEDFLHAGSERCSAKTRILLQQFSNRHIIEDPHVRVVPLGIVKTERSSKPRRARQLRLRMTSRPRSGDRGYEVWERVKSSRQLHRAIAFVSTEQF